MNPLVPNREIILWNANGISNRVKLASLLDLIRRSSPMAVVLTETHLSADTKTRIAEPNLYHEFSSHHTSRSSGTSILIHRAFNARTLTKQCAKLKHGGSAAILHAVEVTDPSVDATGAQASKPIVIAAGYIHPAAPIAHQSEYINAINDLIRHCEITGSKLILAGDFNTHSADLGTAARLTSNRGNQLVAEVLSAAPLYCANRHLNSTPTHRLGGTLDLFLTTDQHMITSLAVLEDELTKLSDHHPVRASVGIACPALGQTMQPKWKIKSAEWSQYTAATIITASESRKNWTFASLYDSWEENGSAPAFAQATADSLAQDLSEQITKAAEMSLKRLPPPPLHRRADLPVTDAIRTLIRSRRTVANKYVASLRSGKNPSLVVKLAGQMRTLRAQIASEMRTESRKRWSDLCDSIQEPDGIHIGRINYSAFDRTIGRSNVVPTGIVDPTGRHPNSIVGSLTNMANFQSRTVHATPDGETREHARRN